MNWQEQLSLPLFYNMVARRMLPGFRACRSILGPVAFLGWLLISGYPSSASALCQGQDISGLKPSLLQGKEQLIATRKMLEESNNNGNSGEILPVGLRNLRNTCYMNAVLQCLYSVKQFSLAITMKAYRFKNDSIGYELQDLFLKMNTTGLSRFRLPIRPQNLAEKLKINVNEQEDAEELLLKILNELDESVVKKKSKKNKKHKTGRSTDPSDSLDSPTSSTLSSPATTTDDASSLASEQISQCKIVEEPKDEPDLPPTSALKMEIHQSIRCINVNHVSSEKVDEYLDLSLNIKGCKTLEDAIREYFTPEMLEGANQYKCDVHGLQDAEKTMKIKKFPRVFVAHLKRFSFDPETYQMKKVVDLVDIPDSLDLSAYAKEDTLSHDKIAAKYNLQAAIIHEGSLEFGHYYAYAKVPINQELCNAEKQHWVKLNDHTVSPATIDEVLQVARGMTGVIPTRAIGPRPTLGANSFSTNAYILFYTQQD